MKMRRAWAVLVSGMVLLLAPVAGADTPEGWSVDEEDTGQIARITGPDSINDTGSRWNVFGTDLGHTFKHKGKTFMVFGDTFGPPGQPPEFGTHWRSNVMGWSSDLDPTDGVTLDGMITDDAGDAREIIPSAHFGENPDGDFEVTIIPTGGVSDDRTMYLHYMSVNEWGPPGQWFLNHSAIVSSSDDGETWELSDVRWEGDSNFGQVAFVERGQHVYLFGIPGGRLGSAQLARVARPDILSPDAYEYWDGQSWVADESQATDVVPAPVGELSVRWNSHYEQWVMMYLHDVRRPEWGTGAVVLRTADCLIGPWSDEEVVVTSHDAPQLYAPYMPPRWNNGEEIYFTLSRFNFYDVFWWQTSLEGDGSENPHEAKCVSP